MDQGSGQALKGEEEAPRIEAAVPRHMRIVQTVSNRIASGLYPPDAKIPSGSELAKEFGVSQMTVRRALNTLAARGLVYGVKGKGTFVAPDHPTNPDFELDSIAGTSVDNAAEVRLLSASMVRANEKIARVLDIAPGRRVVHLRRLVSMAGTPAMYHHEYILYDPRRTLVESQLQLTALEGVLDAERGQRSFGGELTISAVLLDGPAAEALGQEEGDLALSLEHVFRDSEGSPVGYGEFLLRADQFRLRSRQSTARKVIGVEVLADDA